MKHLRFLLIAAALFTFSSWATLDLLSKNNTKPSLPHIENTDESDL